MFQVLFTSQSEINLMIVVNLGGDQFIFPVSLILGTKKAWLITKPRYIPSVYHI